MKAAARPWLTGVKRATGSQRHCQQDSGRHAVLAFGEFARILLYSDSEATFWRWAAWGERLMALHIGCEGVDPFALKRRERTGEPSDSVDRP